MNKYSCGKSEKEKLFVTGSRSKEGIFTVLPSSIIETLGYIEENKYGLLPVDQYHLGYYAYLRTYFTLVLIYANWIEPNPFFYLSIFDCYIINT
ncbi:MAG: hypothetical protein CM15mP87_10030 [Candidatus Neomarinimicrobiota bacterium]|nr:MAG: hypothetical protein CM15mP87_10030 [Candidatus Neomarinimicrobiota bacterium]